MTPSGNAQKRERLTIWYHELEGADFPYVGKKNPNLGDMMKVGIRASPGFALTIYANDLFMQETGIRRKLDDYVSTLGDVSLENCQLVHGVNLK